MQEESQEEEALEAAVTLLPELCTMNQRNHKPEVNSQNIIFNAVKTKLINKTILLTAATKKQVAAIRTEAATVFILKLRRNGF